MKTSIIAARAFAITLMASCSLAAAQNHILQLLVEGEITLARGVSELPSPFAGIEVGDHYVIRQRFEGDYTPTYMNARESSWSNIQTSWELSINGGAWNSLQPSLTSVVGSMLTAESTSQADRLLASIWYRDGEKSGRVTVECEAASGTVFPSLPENSNDLAGLTQEHFAYLGFFGFRQGIPAADVYVRGTVESLEVVLINPSPGAAIVLVMAGTLTRGRRRSSHA